MSKNDFNCIWTDKKRTFLGLPLSFTRYFLTENKFITRTGFLSLTEDEIDLYKITDKKLVLPLGQRMFGCGTIEFLSRDIDTPNKTVKSIKKPREVMQMIDKQIEIARDKYSIRGRDIINDAGGNCNCDDDC